MHRSRCQSTRAYSTIDHADPTSGGTRFQLPAYAAAAVRDVCASPTTGTRAGARRVLVLPTQATSASATTRPEGPGRIDLQHVVSGIEAGWFPPQRLLQYRFRRPSASTASLTLPRHRGAVFRMDRKAADLARCGSPPTRTAISDVPALDQADRNRIRICSPQPGSWKQARRAKTSSLVGRIVELVRAEWQRSEASPRIQNSPREGRRRPCHRLRAVKEAATDAAEQSERAPFEAAPDDLDHAPIGTLQMRSPGGCSTSSVDAGLPPGFMCSTLFESGLAFEVKLR